MQNLDIIKQKNIITIPISLTWVGSRDTHFTEEEEEEEVEVRRWVCLFVQSMDKKLSVVGFIRGAKEWLKMKRESAAVVVVVVAAVWWSIFGFFCLGIWNLSCVYLYCFLSVWNWVEW